MDVFGIEHDDLTRPELAVILIPEVEEGEAFEARAEAVRLFAEDDRRAAELIARGVDAFGVRISMESEPSTISCA